MTAWVASWTLLLLWAVGEVPVDSAEQMAWVRSLQWGYHKHPPLPTWLIAPWVALFGLQDWIPALMGAALKFLSLLLCWNLIARIEGVPRATLALACITGVAYYSSRLHTYSHNEVILACSAGAAWALWRAQHAEQAPQAKGRRHWMLLGLCLGLGLLAKYQAVTTVAAVLVYATLAGLWARPHQRRGLVLALVVAALVVTPHVWWLAHAPHTPLGYAVDSSLGTDLGVFERVRQLLVWKGNLVLRALGALLILMVVSWWARVRHQRQALAPGTAAERPESMQQGRLLLWCWAMVPLAFVCAMALLGGSTVRPHWAIPMALWIIAALSTLVPERGLLFVARRRFIGLLVLVQLILAAELLWSESRSAVAEARWGQPMVQRWANAVAEAARLELGGEIRVVIAPETVASTFALAVRERPYPVLDGRLEISPWVPNGLIERCGVLFIVFEPPGPGRHPVPGGPAEMIWRTVPALDGKGCRGNDKAP